MWARMHACTAAPLWRACTACPAVHCTAIMNRSPLHGSGSGTAGSGGLAPLPGQRTSRPSARPPAQHARRTLGPIALKRSGGRSSPAAYSRHARAASVISVAVSGSSGWGAVGRRGSRRCEGRVLRLALFHARNNAGQAADSRLLWLGAARASCGQGPRTAKLLWNPAGRPVACPQAATHTMRPQSPPSPGSSSPKWFPTTPTLRSAVCPLHAASIVAAQQKNDVARTVWRRAHQPCGRQWPKRERRDPGRERALAPATFIPPWGPGAGEQGGVSWARGQEGRPCGLGQPRRDGPCCAFSANTSPQPPICHSVICLQHNWQLTGARAVHGATGIHPRPQFATNDDNSSPSKTLAIHINKRTKERRARRQGPGVPSLISLFSW